MNFHEHIHHPFVCRRWVPYTCTLEIFRKPMTRWVSKMVTISSLIKAQVGDSKVMSDSPWTKLKFQASQQWFKIENRAIIKKVNAILAIFW